MTAVSPKRLWHFGDELTKPTFIVLFVSGGNADKATVSAPVFNVGYMVRVATACHCRNALSNCCWVLMPNFA